MDDQKKPRSRERRVSNEGKGVEKKGEGLGTGPVNNTGSYEDRKAQQGAPQQGVPQRPATQNPFQGGSRPSSGGMGFGQRPQARQPSQQQPEARPSQSG
ncbi:MAG: hypothetical protein K6E17_07435, partial [Clostridiales bacterium]|nr:hypothetical protein [Clostridiales bacterium]